MKELQITLSVNGENRQAQVSTRMTLVDCLRDVLRLTGTHVGCEHGICGACSILLDGEPVRSCLMFAVQAEGHQITTVEGLSTKDGELSDLQDSFWECHAMQCGYCTPGMLIAKRRSGTAAGVPHPHCPTIDMCLVSAGQRRIGGL